MAHTNVRQKFRICTPTLCSILPALPRDQFRNLFQKGRDIDFCCRPNPRILHHIVAMHQYFAKAYDLLGVGQLACDVRVALCESRKASPMISNSRSTARRTIFVVR